MGFLHPAMRAGQRPEHRHAHPVSRRPEVVGGLPLWLASRARRALRGPPPAKPPSSALRDLADVVEASEAELATLREQVESLQRLLNARGASEGSETASRLFGEVCRLQTRATKREREARGLRALVAGLRRERDAYRDDVVMLSAAFLGLLVVYFGYLTAGTDVLARLGAV